jgi:uncharacterized protein (TIGR03084 family)
VTDIAALLEDLAAEGDELDAIVSNVDENGWRVITPAEGWTVAHQVAHLNWTDKAAILAATDVDGFSAMVRAAIADPTGFVDVVAAQGAAMEPADLLDVWRRGRGELITALLGVPAGTRLPWFGPPMSAASMATARLMETFAHGQDVTDALRMHRPPTARLRHVAHIGVRTVGFAFMVHGLAVPEEPFRVELTGPGGELWTWGDESAANRVTGTALDFCLLVTQRRHPDDLDITAIGDQARQWVPIAQAFAGAPGPGRKPARSAAP